MNPLRELMNKFLDAKLLTYKELLSLKPLEWFDFTEGVNFRNLPTGFAGFMCLECTMAKGSKVDKHKHDYFENFLILEGLVRDNLTGLLMKPDGKVRKWKEGTPHEPEALEDSKLLIFGRYLT